MQGIINKVVHLRKVFHGIVSIARIKENILVGKYLSIKPRIAAEDLI